MKKLLLILLVATLTISCDDNPNDVQCIPCTVDESNFVKWKIINLVVSEKDWVENLDLDGLNRFYSYQFNMPEITNTILEEGSLSTYIILGKTQQVLPYVRHFENSEKFIWTRTVDCDYAVNKMNIYVTNSDFADNDIPGTMNFRVVLMW